MGTPDKRTARPFYQPVSQTAIPEGDFASAGEVNANYGYIVLRTRLEPEQMENALRATVHEIDPQLPLYHIQTMEDAIASSEAPRRFNTILISCFAVVAVFAECAWHLRHHCLLGRVARTGDGAPHGAGLSAIGGARAHPYFGSETGGGWLLLRLAGRRSRIPPAAFFLFAVSPFDPVVLTIAAVAMLLLALAASALPARRASRIDPMLILRGE